MKKIIKYFSIFEWCLYLLGVALILLFYILFKNKDYISLIGALVGVTALIFVSKGNVIGQIITVIFSIFYGIVSYSYKYYGEMITYLCMTTPIATAAVITWIKNPSKESRVEVKVNTLKVKEYILLILLSIIVTLIFYFILKYLNTNNLIVSTISITTSFIASYLTMRRSRFYALAYAANDIVLIILWILASISSIEYISMVTCFITFLANDIYGFINWTKLLNNQQK